jgi:hypothetical protein
MYRRDRYFLFLAGFEPSPLLLLPLIGLLYQPWTIDDDDDDDDDDDCEVVRGMNEWQKKPKNSEQTCLRAVPSTTEST